MTQRLHVTNLSFDVTRGGLVELFARHGRVLGVDLSNCLKTGYTGARRRS